MLIDHREWTPPMASTSSPARCTAAQQRSKLPQAISSSGRDVDHLTAEPTGLALPRRGVGSRASWMHGLGDRACAQEPALGSAASVVDWAFGRAYLGCQITYHFLTGFSVSGNSTNLR